ncbi:conserved hypothetical protein [Roseibium sp. TrichSKD4]|uniref:phage tail assembly protein n=1 Tax=Roseibium sp. TrichSKD4 TaxID=744980 RepID=UPI0001E5677E|nr:phage tail assembly protein [Roseibium sp. TrichSKD4]EFO31688.1 conserved hypothetical protein [Roseibium sp. TrichSKD4]
MSGTEPKPFELDELETLPPEELTDALDNSGGGNHSATREVEAPQTEQLEFLSDETSRFQNVPLDHPFKRGGETVKSIPVRKLTGGEVEDLVRKAGGDLSFYKVYEAQTGYPEAVLRGLQEEDWHLVKEACTDFFPRSLRAESA